MAEGICEDGLARFYAKVALPNADGCMLWLGGINAKGYGYFKYRRVMMRAHRVALWIAEGPPNESNLQAAHSCRNTHCVAPAHLRWATPLGNQRDRDVDGTHNRGQRNSRAKLTWGQVREIRAKADQGIRRSVLAAEYSVGWSQIERIVSGQSWVEEAS